MLHPNSIMTNKVTHPVVTLSFHQFKHEWDPVIVCFLNSNLSNAIFASKRKHQ